MIFVLPRLKNIFSVKIDKRRRAIIESSFSTRVPFELFFVFSFCLIDRNGYCFAVFHPRQGGETKEKASLFRALVEYCIYSVATDSSTSPSSSSSTTNDEGADLSSSN